MNAFEREKLKREIEQEVKQEFDEKIKRGQIKVVPDNPQKSFQNRVSELAKNNRLIK